MRIEKFEGIIWVLLVIAVAIIGGIMANGNIAECERDGHSYWYCYQLLYGKR